MAHCRRPIPSLDACSALAEREPRRDAAPSMIPCSTYEFVDQPAEVLEKILVQGAEVLIFAPEDLRYSGRARLVAAVIPLAQYERYLELEAHAREIGRLIAEAN